MELYNQEAEALVLAGMLKHPDAFWSINEVALKSEDFLGSENRRVFKAIDAVVSERKQPDMPLILEELRVSDAGTTHEYLARLSTLVVSVPQAIEYARTVKGLAVSRELASVGAGIIEIAREHRSDTDAAISEAETMLRKVRDAMPAPERSPDPTDILRRMRTAGPSSGIPLRFSPTIQTLTGGLHAGHFWVVGGFSSTGKSAVACNIVRDVMRERGRWVGIISTEMTQEQYLVRLLSLISNVPQRAIRDRLPTDSFDSAQALKDAEAEIARANLRVFDTVYRMADIRLQAQRMKETTGLDVLLIDFLQNVSGSSGDEVGDAREVAIQSQLLAKELNCTVIAFSQVSNEMARYQQDGGDNNYYSFKGSGAIRDAADVGIMLKRDRVKQSPILDFHIVKNRHGELSVVPTHLDLPTGKITEMEAGEED
jgi:replicative DNA helicase